ncbi:hypothetical protein [Enterococcus faecalis]|uniref:hypothetical protein n=1 Tax=Enterococcus faecalis TaxID=1351 RepID=UPI00045B44C8|nr:hypothetical protein [Enterococcus faecalis]KAJ60557.1 hypothetical protein P785_1928 [Enterococcus faecalis KS19]
MSTERHGEKENRHSFEEAKNKRIFEAEIDKAREKVSEKKEEKQKKRFLREHK